MGHLFLILFNTLDYTVVKHLNKKIMNLLVLKVVGFFFNLKVTNKWLKLDLI